jgi:hypothetical protein
LLPSSRSKNKHVACGDLIATSLKLVSRFTYSSTQIMEPACSSAMLVYVQRTTLRYIQEDRALQNHCFENLESYSQILCEILQTRI